METTQIGPLGQNADVTRALPQQAAGADATMVVGGDVTQMAASVRCPVCGTMNSPLETYCVECGFLMSSMPGEDAGTASEGAAAFALVEERSGRRFPLHEGVNLVGRENGDVLLMEPTVSRRHGEIVVMGDRVEVRDLGSTNGTQVDGAPVSPGAAARLRNGSAVRFGNAVFRFEGEGVQAEPDDAASVTEDAKAEDATGEAVALLRAQDPTQPDIAVRRGITSIGRRSGNTHVMAGDPYVSGRHAELEVRDEGVHLTDVGSTNGTVVNGTKLTPNVPVTLLPGDEIIIGQSRFVFEEAQPAVGELLDPNAELDAHAEPPGGDSADVLDEEIVP